jgi:hypothetical protein
MQSHGAEIGAKSPLHLQPHSALQGLPAAARSLDRGLNFWRNFLPIFLLVQSQRSLHVAVSVGSLQLDEISLRSPSFCHSVQDRRVRISARIAA